MVVVCVVSFLRLSACFCFLCVRFVSVLDVVVVIVFVCFAFLLFVFVRCCLLFVWCSACSVAYGFVSFVLCCVFMFVVVLLFFLCYPPSAPKWLRSNKRLALGPTWGWPLARQGWPLARQGAGPWPDRSLRRHRVCRHTRCLGT